MKIHLDNKENGYIIVDDFFDDALLLSNEMESIPYYKKSKEYWPPPLYSFESNNGIMVEVENVEISGEFLWNKDEGNLIPDGNYSQNFLSLMDKFQKNLFKLFEELDYVKNNHIQRLVTIPYMWPQGSSILWHDDGFHSFGTSFYLNESWNPDCGGELMLSDGKWVYPKFNRLIILTKKLQHKVNTISDGCNPRYTLQSFSKI